MLALLAALLWSGTLLAQVQIRSVYVASAFLPLAAGWFLDWLVSNLATLRSNAARASSGIAAILIFGIAWTPIALAAQSLAAGRFNPAPNRAPCADPRYLSPLDRFPPGLVLGQNDLGPNILVHTHHSILVAGYHRAKEGVIAGIKAFAGTEADLREQVEKFHVDYIALCPSWLPPASQPRSFAREIAEGRSVPWLEPLALPDGPLKAWRVVR